MGKTIALFLVTAGFLFSFTGPLKGQEVNSDVKIPLPRELVTGAPAINGLLVGTQSLFRSLDPLAQGSSAQATLSVSNEGQTREELGDFMTSLMVKAGIIAFDRGSAPLAASEKDPNGRSRPAWTGRAPLVLSVSRTGRSESLRRRRSQGY